MDAQTKKCPMCAETIKAEAKICRFCHARFEVTARGYCLNDHAIVDMQDGKCARCGSEVTDQQIESKLLTETPPESQPTPPTEQTIPPHPSPEILKEQSGYQHGKSPCQVIVPYHDTYKTPLFCSVCGSATIGLTFHTETESSTWVVVGTIRRKVGFNLPICAECAEAVKEDRNASRIGCLVALLLAGLPAVLIFFGAINNFSYSIIVLIVSALLAYFGTRYFILKGTDNHRTRRKWFKSTKIVRVDSIIGLGITNIVFSFANEKFASIFCEQNGGEFVL